MDTSIRHYKNAPLSISSIDKQKKSYGGQVCVSVDYAEVNKELQGSRKDAKRIYMRF